MRYESLDSNMFVENRKKVTKQLELKSIAILNSNDVLPSNADGTMPFIQNSDLFWLCGIDQEDTILVLCPNQINKQMREILFIKKTNEHIAVWEGAKLTKKEASNISGVSSVFWTSELEDILEKVLSSSDAIYLNRNIHSRATKVVQTRDDRFKTKITNKYPNKKIKELAPILHEMRVVKSQKEVELINKACKITEKGFRRILPIIKPGIMEFEIEAELIHEFIVSRSRRFAYQPIIASGKDSCVLHYTANNKACREGDLLLMDFGAEYANYASDMTRTVPVNGRYSLRQKNVYNSVLRVMKSAIKMLTVGTLLKEYNKQVGILMENELVKLGVLDNHDIKKQDAKNPLYKKYFMHGTSHYLGLDVHDVGSLEWPIKAGMIFTCEPGIYLPNENIGVRLENDILITDDGQKDLMASIPIESEEIEELMHQK